MKPEKRLPGNSPDEAGAVSPDHPVSMAPGNQKESMTTGDGSPSTMEADQEPFERFPQVAMHIADEQGFLLFASPALDRRFGFERGFLIGKHISLLNHFSPQGCKEKIRGIFENLRSRGFWEGELFNRTAQGSPSSGYSRIYPLFINGCQYWLGFEEEGSTVPPPADPSLNVPDPQAVIRSLIEQWSLLHFPDMKLDIPRGLQAIGDMNAVFFSLNAEGLFTSLSPGIEGLLGYPPKEMLGAPLARFIHPRDLEDYRRSLERWLQGTLDSSTLRFLDQKKNIRHIKISCCRILRGGQTAGAAGLLWDVPHPKWPQALHLRAEKKYRHIFENAVDGIYQRTFDGRFITANPACARILGYTSPAELTLSTPDPQRPFYGSPERQAEFQHILRELGMVQEFEYLFCRKDNQKIWIAESAQAVRDALGEVLFYEGTMKDITERKAAEERVKFLSFHDRVTGLYNRAFFEEELSRLNTARQLPLSVIIGDVNSLKLMNDAFGHSEGDRLLVHVAAILKECCRKEDVVARLGGDEFAILLPRTNRRSTLEIIERIQLACRNLSRNTPPVSIALGASTKEEHTQDIRQIIKEAEDCMYREKLSASQDYKKAIFDYLRHTLSHQCHETEDHLVRSQRLARPVGQALGLEGTLMEDLALLAELHDIGKIAIPPEILGKTDGLSPSEWEAVRKHPEVGGRIARSIPELASVADAVLSHHERWDGQGYPRGLRGKEIPLLARIFSIVDAYEVMTRGRPYKPAMSHGEALAEIKRGAGSQFDPELADWVANTVWAGPPVV